MIARLYDLILCLSALFLVPYYLVRGIRYGKARRGLRERLGFFTPELKDRILGQDVIWVHAVSVGETRAAIPLFRALKARYPNAFLVLSNVTETGREMARKIPEADACIFFPFDLSWVVRKVLKLINPKIIILVETEIWPNFVLEARQLNLPVILVNGRISDRSLPRYRKVMKILKPVIDGISAFCMQTAQDARRIRLLGAPSGRVYVTGNMKFDMAPLPMNDLDFERLRQSYKIPDDIKTWVAGSTHAGEEDILVEVYLKIRTHHPNLLLIIVPRHPERARLICENLTKSNIPWILRTELEQQAGNLKPGDVLVVDTIGEMLKLYGVADFVFVGGSLVPVGGHNILEAALMKKPVFFGSYMQNFKEIARLVRQAHGGLQVSGAEDLYRQMRILIENPDEARRIGENGHRLLDENRGATEKTIAEINRRILD
ncbi:MAG: 3-deoxy-D-manno-octulosonic acid transferase [Deltaproteobacteria bacterium]|jgi:3-deoxy-D-manno-octulosonic-acid transferase|nr:3-deoxy-D-manno-octulosonic acid transferase [Deltaproteobacteria bacterium]